MASLKEVKSRITSVISIQQITKAMKMVAAAKLRKSQERITQMRPFAQKLTQLFQNLSAAGQGEPTWYNTARPEEKILIVVVSSDRGLCGSFNSTVIKAVNREIAETHIGRKFVELQGWVNQFIAKKADKVTFMVSGLPMQVK